MKTVFSLFLDIQTAQNAVEKLLQAGFTEEQMNAITQEVLAKEYLEITDPKTMVLKTDQIGNKEIHGLASIFIGKKGISISDVGRVLAGGIIAVELAGTASVKPHGGLKVVLQDFNIPESVAERYTRGLIAGGVLLCLRTEDQRQGEVIQILNNNRGVQVHSIQPGTPAI